MLTNRNTLALVLCVLSLPMSGAYDRQPVARAGTIEPLPRDLEIQLALSSLPAHLRDGATVYVLHPEKGFDVARTGTNVFHALVARTGDDAMRGSWPLTDYPDDILYPIAWDRAGAQAQRRVFLDIAEMQARGTQPQDVKRIIQERYRTKCTTRRTSPTTTSERPFRLLKPCVTRSEQHGVCRTEEARYEQFRFHDDLRGRSHSRGSL